MFVQIIALGPKMAPPWGSHVLHIGLNREQHEKIFLSETTRPRALIFGMKRIIWWTSTKFVQIRPLGPKMAMPQGSHALLRLI